MEVRVRALLAAMLIMAVAACASGPESLGDPNLDAGREIFGRVCSSCHGGTGSGGSAPALTSILETFPHCETHRQWVTLGSERWKKEVGPVYGAPGKEITAIMPSFAAVLTEDEIQQVASFERFRFAGGEMAAVLADCGLG
ncbi:MAG TPA: cytochrome c [Acidimicrobiia bacterium]|nr:cytochrome c [Acidimicrobiia bacterium]